MLCWFFSTNIILKKGDAITCKEIIAEEVKFCYYIYHDENERSG